MRGIILQFFKAPAEGRTSGRGAFRGGENGRLAKGYEDILTQVRILPAPRESDGALRSANPKGAATPDDCDVLHIEVIQGNKSVTGWTDSLPGRRGSRRQLLKENAEGKPLKPRMLNVLRRPDKNQPGERPCFRRVRGNPFSPGSSEE